MLVSEKQRMLFESCLRLIRSKRGTCLSNSYDKDNYLRVKCNNKFHKPWKTSRNNLHAGRWCPECAGVKTASRSKLIKIIKGKGGKVIDLTYSNNRNDILLKCRFDHTFSIKITALLVGSWCKECGLGASERITRMVFEKLYKYKFESCRPSWLVNKKTKMPLELDGYSERLKLAFELQGLHHFKAVDYYGGETTLNKIKHRDTLKRRMCHEHGVKLIAINWFNPTMNNGEINDYFRKEFERNGIPWPIGDKDIIINLKSVFLTGKQNEYTQKVFIAAKNQGKTVLNHFIHSSMDILDCLDPNGHLQKIAASELLTGRSIYCRKCAGKDYDEKVYQELAKRYGFHFIGPMPKKKNMKTVWECSQGHRFYRGYTTYSFNPGCPVCWTADFKAEQILKLRGLKIVDRVKKHKYLIQCKYNYTAFMKHYRNISYACCNECNQTI